MVCVNYFFLPHNLSNASIFSHFVPKHTLIYHLLYSVWTPLAIFSVPAVCRFIDLWWIAYTAAAKLPSTAARASVWTALHAFFTCFFWKVKIRVIRKLTDMTFYSSSEVTLKFLVKKSRRIEIKWIKMPL